MYKVILLLVFTPIIAILFNVFNLYSTFAWYIPIFVMFIFFIRELIVNRDFFKREHIIKNIFLYLYVILVFISCLFSNYKFEAFFGTNFEGLFTLIAYLGFFYVGSCLSSRQLDNTYKGILLVSFVLSILMLMKNNLSYFLFDMDKNQYYFYRGSFDHFNHAAYYLLIANVISLFMFIRSNRKVLYFIINLILLYTLVINDTFGVFIAYVIVLLFVIMYFCFKNKNMKEVLLIILSFFLISCITFRDGHNIVLNNLNGLVSDANVVVNKDMDMINTIGTNRGELWIKGTELILKRPLLGYGFENMRYAYERYNIFSDKPHNIVLELSMSSGIPAMVLYLFFVMSIIIKGLKNVNKLDDTVVMSLVIVIAYLLSSLVGNQTLYVAPYYYLFLGALARKA